MSTNKLKAFTHVFANSRDVLFSSDMPAFVRQDIHDGSFPVVFSSTAPVALNHFLEKNTANTK